MERNPRGFQDRPRRAGRWPHRPRPPATLARLLQAQINLNRPDCQLLPNPRGRLWRERTLYRDVWKPTQQASGLDIRPHECRHSYVTHLRAAGVNDADLAETTGHSVLMMLS